MMKKSYNVTGSDRKEMVQVIGRAAGVEPVYLRMPTCAYEVGNMLINRNGDLLWDERTDDATIQKVVEALWEAGYTAEEDPEPVELTVSLPTRDHNANSLRNLVNLIFTRAGLINKALGSGFAAEQGLVDALSGREELRTAADFCKALAAYEDEHGPALTGITITPEVISFSSLPENADPEHMKAFTELVAMMNQQALTQKRIQAKAVNWENEKYALRIWLTRLGMNGAAYKTTRKILMENLFGHSAFRTEAEKQRWIARQAERKEATQA